MYLLFDTQMGPIAFFLHQRHVQKAVREYLWAKLPMPFFRNARGTEVDEFGGALEVIRTEEEAQLIRTYIVTAEGNSRKVQELLMLRGLVWNHARHHHGKFRAVHTDIKRATQLLEEAQARPDLVWNPSSPAEDLAPFFR